MSVFVAIRNYFGGLESISLDTLNMVDVSKDKIKVRKSLWFFTNNDNSRMLFLENFISTLEILKLLKSPQPFKMPSLLSISQIR